MARQFTVRLKNAPGALAELAARFGEHGIDIRTISVGAVGSHGCAVLSTNDDAATSAVLKRARYTFVEGDVLRVGVADQPGALGKLAQRLAAANVNVTGLVLLGRHQGKAELGLTVDDPVAARRALDVPA
jgi:hypothetical protein